MSTGAQQSTSASMTQNCLLCAVLVQACIDDDFTELLKHFPVGIEYRASRYSTAEDFELAGSYEDNARYQYPAREKMKDMVLKFVVQKLKEAENGT